MGPSGSGKTTLLELIGGHAPRGAFAGSRLLNGVRYEDASEYDAIMRRQGYVAQRDSAFFEPLTVWETIAYMAALRLPAQMPLDQKMVRAATALRQVELVPVSGARIGGGDAGDGISGGQARRLSIALELIHMSGVLLLDEPTSGLDSATSLRIAQLMARLANGPALTDTTRLATETDIAAGSQRVLPDRGRSLRTVVTTIHQPRADIFGLFDDVVLLATGGEVVYAGLATDAGPFIAAAPCLAGVVASLRHGEGTNPADFLIDVLGLDASNVGTSAVQSAGGARVAGATSSPPAASTSADTDGDFEKAILPLRSTSAGFGADADAGAGAEPGPFSETGVEAGAGTKTNFAPTSSAYTTMSTRDALVAHYKSSTLQSSTLRYIGERARAYGPIISVIEERNGWRTRRTHTVAMFARRVRRLTESRPDIVLRYLQVLVVGSIISIGFSYDVSSKLQRPYQTFMLLLMLSSYAMVLQYVELVPEYFGERAVLDRERRLAGVRFDAYVLAGMLTETPRAMAHSALLLAIGCALAH